jgi:Ca2+-binding EF-hand superfamily protein
LRPVFERLGKDALTKEDFVNAVGQLGGRPGGEGGRPDPARAGEFFNRLDANGDGKVTLDEVPEPAKRMVEGALRRLKKGEGEGLTREEFVRALAEGRPGEGRPGEGRPGEGRPGEARPAEGRGEERRPEGRPGEVRPGEARPAEGRPGEGRAGDGRPEGRPPLPKFFRTLDTNGDGRLSREELSKAAELLDQLDENKDGQLDPRELLGPPPGGRPGEGRPGEGRPGEGRPGEGRPAINPGERRPEGNAPAGRPGRPEGAQFGEQLFNRLDANKDGKISKDEAQGPLRENFDRFDADKDGFVTLEELRRGMAARLRDGEGRRPNGERPNPNRANPDGQKPEEKKSEEKKPE